MSDTTPKIYLLPNLMTAGNLFCGFAATLKMLQGALLQASGKYSYEWLKEERNLWHPDRFARFVHPDHMERLTLMAEQMFVMYGILMEACKA